MHEPSGADRIYGPRLHFPGELYDGVMRALHVSLPPFVRVTFNFTDESETPDCWVQLFRHSSDPDADMASLLSEAIAAARTANACGS